MNPEETGKAYNQISHLWDRDTFDQENGIIQHQRAISFSNNRGPALDVGCGRNSRFRSLLIDHGQIGYPYAARINLLSFRYLHVGITKEV